MLVVHEGRCSILVSTDLSLMATDIIGLYGYRLKIECTISGNEASHPCFWLPLLEQVDAEAESVLEKEEAHPLKAVTNEQDRQRIQKTIQAIEGFVMCQCIAMGLLQLIALQFSGRTSGLFFRYLRTPSHAVVSEASVAAYLRKSIFRLFAQNPHLSLTQIIKSKQKNADVERDLLVS